MCDVADAVRCIFLAPAFGAHWYPGRWKTSKRKTRTPGCGASAGPVFCRRNAETGVNANAAKHPKKVLKSITRFYVHTQKIRATVGCPDFWYILTQKMFLVVASHPRITVYLNHTDLRKRSDSELQGDNHAVFHFSADKVVKTTHYPKGPCMTKHLCMQRKCLT